MAKLPPDINDYLEQIGDGKPVTAEHLDDLIYKIVVHTGYNYEISKIIVKNYFQEIRNELLKGTIIPLLKIGKIFVRCPKNGTSNKKIYLTIKPYKKFNYKIKYTNE